MTCSLRVLDQRADLARRGWRFDAEANRYLLEVGSLIVDVVLFGIEERGANVAASIADRDVVERREPSRLGKQSKCRADHQILQRARAALGAATRQRFVGFDDKPAHPPLQVDILKNSRSCPRRDTSLLARLCRHLLAQALDLAALFIQVDLAHSLSVAGPRETKWGIFLRATACC